jgi:hypothetical protein
MKDSTKEMLGNFSPIYGIATGHGMIGKLADKGMLGLGPMAIAQGRRKKADGSDVTPEEEAAGMKKGGTVKSSASKRADGCAQRGKTRGKVI